MHETSVSVAPSALQPLQKWASPPSFWFSETNSYLFQRKKKKEQETRMNTWEGHYKQIDSISGIL